MVGIDADADFIENDIGDTNQPDGNAYFLVSEQNLSPISGVRVYR